MIRNVIILDIAGSPILAKNFGECHSFPPEADRAGVLSGFISALFSFGKNLTGQEISEVNFGSLYLFVISRNDFIFVLAVDDNKTEENKTKLERIAELFFVKYGYRINENHTIDESSIKDFPDLLLSQNLVQNNCGDYEDCIGCPNSNKSLPVKDLTHELKNQ
jgi:hypothetical protein